ncbi:MAG: transporter, family, lactate transporter [Verrucomicrobiota bacterium]|jgi:SHS family lactate transporter-like MFS transporter
METLRLFKALTRDQRNTFVACFLGWALDALDFFLLTFVFSAVAQEFGKTVPEVAFASMLTLMFRPLGALIFGYLGDRFGRRIPLMVDIIFYSVIEMLTAFSPNFTVFLILRALFGIGMGGEWGLGASLLMETLPAKSRGLFSGILQQGYAFGLLLAAIVYWLVFPHFGWRGLFVAGAAPALLVIFIRMRVPESPSWERHKVRLAKTPFATVVRQHWRLFVYAILLMTVFNCMSHGTQDVYPTFLQKQCGLDVPQVRNVSIIYSLGAICGGTLFGALSQHWGRRRSIILAAAVGILLIPVWILSSSLGMLIAGGFCMQFMVQGAWGVVPVHLNELSPPEMRGTFPGFVYQLGNLFAAPIAVVETKLAESFPTAAGGAGYAKSLAIVTLIVFLALITLAAVGKEKRGIEF